MRALSGISNLGANYALHVDVALEPDKSSEDVVVVVRDGVIADVSSAAAFLPARDLPPPIRLPGTAIIPGIMDVHHHIIEPFAKALTGGEPAQLWRRFWLPLEAVATPRTVYIGAKWTFLEALRGGITTIVDHGLRSRDIVDAIHRAADETGIRLVSSTGAYDKKNFSTSAATPGADNSIHDALAIARQHLDDCKGFKRISPSIACGTVQSNSGDMIAALSGFCRDQIILFQIHANEHTLEVHASIEASGRRPIEYLHDLGALGSHVLIAHATLVTSEEIKMLATTDTAVAYNPVASLWKGNAVSPVLDFFSAGIRVGLGSDATRNDGFRMIDAAEACQRIAYGMPRDDFSCGAGWRWIDAATHRLGKALKPVRRPDRAGLQGGFPASRPHRSRSAAVLGLRLGTRPLLRSSRYSRNIRGWRGRVDRRSKHAARQWKILSRRSRRGRPVDTRREDDSLARRERSLPSGRQPRSDLTAVSFRHYERRSTLRR